MRKNPTGPAGPRRASRPVMERLEERLTPASLIEINFDNFAVQSYNGPTQDLTGPATVEDGGATLHLAGNRWKKVALPYTVTRDTVLEFDFKSNGQGEIHGIGLDNDNQAENAPVKTFQLSGTQTFGIGAHRDYVAGSGWKHYKVRVGDFFTGPMTALTFAMDDDDPAGPVADAFFRDVTVYEPINFGNFAVQSYNGPTQDLTGPATVEDGGATLHLAGNRWKKVALPYTVTRDTVLEFDFKSNGQGEIHGIGLDNDNQAENAPVKTFQLSGTQTFGIGAHRDYVAGSGWKHYKVRVGDFFTGPMTALTFAMDDDDPAGPVADAFFRDVTVYERPAVGVGGGPSVNPVGFKVTTFASGLHFPSGMLELSDGSLLVATATPAGGSFYGSPGQLLRLVDGDGDGHADGPGTVLYSGLPPSVTAIEKAGGFILVADAGRQRITVLRVGATPTAPYTLAGSINFSFPSGWEHRTYALAVRPTPGAPGRYDVFFNVGSQFNINPTTATVSIGGLIAGTLNGDSIYKVTLDARTTTPVFSGLTQIATGLRNAAGIEFHPTTGDLYFADNGIDNPSNREEPLSADELNRIAASAIGGAIEDFGYSRDYIEYRTGRRVGSGAIQPLVAFQPLPDPKTGSESEGPNQIAFAPASFPTGANNGVLVGFHGRGNLGGVANEENPLVYYDLAARRYFHFISNNEPNIGHLDSLLATSNALFVADMTSTGNMNGTTPSGVIYRISRA